MSFGSDPIMQSCMLSSKVPPWTWLSAWHLVPPGKESSQLIRNSLGALQRMHDVKEPIINVEMVLSVCRHNRDKKS